MPQLGDKSGNVTDRAVAQRTPYQIANPAPAPSMELDGLMRGLSQFNSELGHYTDSSIRRYTEQERAKRELEMRTEQERRAAVWDPQKESMSEYLARDLPSGLPPAFGPEFRAGLGRLLVGRQAVVAKTEIAAAYEEAKKAPDFNAEQFIAASRQKYLGGLTDDVLIGSMGRQLNEIEGAIRTQAEKERLIRLDEAANTGLFSAMQETLRADMTPAQLANQYSTYLPEWAKLGKSRKELAGMFLQRVQFLSDQMGGNPALFDAFDSKDPTTGQTLLAMNPDLADNVARAREHAKAKNQRLLLEAAQTANLPKRVALDRQLEQDPASITPEVVMREMGPLGLFSTTEQAAAYLAHARKAAADRMGDAVVMQAYNDGTLGRYKPEDQRKALEARLGPAIDAAWKAANEGDANAMTGLAAFIVSEQNRARATVPVDALERLISTTLSTVQDPSGPPPAFQAVAALYRGLSADPKFRSMYFKDDIAQVMDTYVNSIGGKADPATAYRTAYQSVSPEAKAAAEKLKTSPEFAKKLKSISEQVTGVTFWDRWVPFWGSTPQNPLRVQTDAAWAAREFLARTPSATEAQAMGYAQSWVRDNYVFDKASGSAVRVPPGLADDTTQEALTEYSRRVAEAYRLKDRNDGEWSVQFMPLGEGGRQSVVLARDGVPSHMLGSVPLADLRASFLAEKHSTPQDREVLMQLQQQMQAGRLDLGFIEANSGALAKAEKLGLLSREQSRTIEKTRLEQARSLVESVPKLSLGVPSMENLANVPSRGLKVDNKLTAQTALHVLAQPGHLGYAASLITMGEAVMLRAYPDPAKDAGDNIGMGYNLKANSKTAASDLAKAGVPQERIADVMAGRAQVTPEQAQRLLFATLPRYEKQAREAAESTAPGLWSRMTPQQRAVMIDVGWQTGSPEQFRKAWSALASGDAPAFAEQTRVFYRNRDGKQVEDKRRGELRAAMLAGHEPWVSTVQRFGTFPSTALDALALNQPQQSQR